MTTKSVRIASAVSLAFTSTWLIITALIYIFQESIISSYILTSFVGEKEPVFLLSTAVNILGAALIIASAVLILNEKTAIIPLIFSVCAAIFAPPIAELANALQLMLTARLKGEYALIEISAMTQPTSYASHILNIATTCAVAASAVYAYEKKKGRKNENPEIS